MRWCLIVFLAGCGGTTELPEPHASEPTALPAQTRVLGGASANDDLPLIVALHGRGSDPDRFANFFEGADTRARLLLIEAPVDEGSGRAWFTFRGKDRGEIATEMRELAGRILSTTHQTLQQGHTVGRPILTGFSQGAMLVYVLALEHADEFALAVPVSGTLFGSFVPEGHVEAPPFIVLHGEDDPIIPLRSGRQNLDVLRARGADVTFRVFSHTPHWIMGEMKTALHETIRAATAR